MKGNEISRKSEDQGSKTIRFDLLTSGEHIILEIRPLIWPRLIGAAIWILLGIFIYASPSFLLNEFPSLDITLWQVIKWIGVAIMALSLLSLLAKWLKWRYTIYGITNKRVLRQTGVLSRTYMECSLGKIQNTYIDMSILGRLFDYGAIRMATAGTAGYEIHWNNVKSPVKVQLEINEAMDKLGKVNSNVS